jgi:hypothetical protein
MKPVDPCITERLVGKRIKSIRYMTDAERRDLIWTESAPIIVLDDGTEISPLSDEEGNSPGSLDIRNNAQKLYEQLDPCRA